MGQKYKLTIANQSTMTGNFCVFQDIPDVNCPGVLTLAWLVKRSHPGTTVDFEWSVDYDFVWSEQGSLLKGTKFQASQVVTGADLLNYNQISFDYDGAYHFSNLTRGPRTGSLYVMEGPDVPNAQAHVGVGMSGKGTFVVPAQPNIELYFTPHPKYYVVFGNYTQGEVIDITEMTKIANVQFDSTHFEVPLKLNERNLWE
ncbi:MAG TPA: protein rhiA [Symbiobacteriaceae bacterium]|nr:protein rhiA [Symbiobacteriaceae bacterium]